MKIGRRLVARGRLMNVVEREEKIAALHPLAALHGEMRDPAGLRRRDERVFAFDIAEPRIDAVAAARCQNEQQQQG